VKLWEVMSDPLKKKCHFKVHFLAASGAWLTLIVKP